MELTLEARQVQKLSPQMIQTMEILQMGAQELREYVDGLLLENPVLDREEPDTVDSDEVLRRMEWLAGSARRAAHTSASDRPAPAAVQPPTQGLYEYLRDQIDFRRLAPVQGRAVECVLAGLDANGYLEEGADQLALRCALPLPVVQRAVELVQSLEPAGVGACSLAQCLELQLLRRGVDGLAVTIVRAHLEDLAKNRYHKIAQQTGASREAVQRACQLIRTLSPKPGAALAPADNPGILIPDLIVWEENGRLTVAANDAQGPLLRVNGYYQRLLAESDDAQVHQYLAEKMRQADWVIRGIEQRRSTLLQCGRHIVMAQPDFFRSGPASLRPMTMAGLAGELGVHPSTVSRAVREKYLQCRHGTFPLSFFFSRALPGGPEGEQAAAEQARAAIAALIQSEDKRHPLSDQKLCDLLARQQLTLARRTVAKYREEMGIPPASGRRVF